MRIPPIKTAALLATAGVSIVALGTAHADEPESNPGLVTTTSTIPATVAAPTTVAPPTTTGQPDASAAPVGGETTVPTAPTAAASLPPGATVQQFQAVLVPFLGPTTDVVGEFATLGVTTPTGVPTPEGTEVDSFSIYYYPDAERPEHSYYNAKVTFTTAVPAAEMVTLFQTQLVAGGYVQTGDSVQNDDGRQVRFLDYEVPNSTYDSAELSIGIVDDDLDFAQLEWSDALDPTLIQAFSSWPTGLPLIDLPGNVIETASLRVDSFGGDFEGSIDTDWTLPIPLADARAQVEAAIPSSPYILDPDYEPTENTIYLRGGEFTTLSVYMGDGYPEGTETYYNVSARFDLQL